MIISCFLPDIQRTKCGNFILEEGEECDAGLSRNDPCCNDDCELRPGAICRCVHVLSLVSVQWVYFVVLSSFFQ